MREPTSSAASIDVGERLRMIREHRGLSQRALAQAAGMSANALSQIERGNVSPSLGTLNRLAAALNVPITAFFETGIPRNTVVFMRADQRPRIPLPRGLIEGLGGELFTGQVEPFFLTLEAGGNSGPHPVVHAGHEFVFCLRGVLEYVVESSTFRLEAGDSLLFAAHQRHRWRNPSSVVTNAIIVLAGFPEGEHPAEGHIAPRAEG